MPLPEPNSKWPPPPFDEVGLKLNEWAAWYSGDPQYLVSVYNGGGAPVATRYQLYGGLVGWVARLFWGTPLAKGTTNTSKLHVPLAEEIAAEGAKQLFKNPPAITAPQSTVHQDAINAFIENGLFTTMLEAGELGSALGDVYIRVGYDLELSDQPLLTVHPSDLVIPSFYYNRLQSATIWRELKNDAGRVFRHIEVHEPQWIYHRLFEGTHTDLGKNIPLSTLPETAVLKESEPTGINELDIIHFPNLRTRLWRKLGQASNLGRSDFGSPGITTLMDALDETYTSLMRDIRLGKYRLLTSQQYLHSDGRGQGASFDIDQEVFVGLNVMADKGSLQIVPAQGDIRVEKLVAAGLALTEKIISGCGYSAQTFGLTGDVAMTATESNARERMTFDTRDIKIGTYKPRLGDLIRVMLKTMVVMGKGDIPPDDISVDFPLPVEEDEKQVAETIKLLHDANAISLYEMIKMRKPDWDDQRIDQEIKRIGESVVRSLDTP